MNPTARSVFLAEQEGLSCDALARLEDGFFRHLRLPNGSRKTTYRNRLADVVRTCNQLLAQRPAGTLQLLDLGISSGITTLEWIEAVDSLGRDYRIDGIDLCLYGAIESVAPGLHVLRDKQGRALQFDIGGWPLANHYGSRFQSRLAASIAVSAARLVFGGLSILNARRVRESRREVQLVTRGLREARQLRLYEMDVFRLGEIGRSYHLIRAANILNRSYFSTAELNAIIGQLRTCLAPGSHLVVARTRAESGQSSAGSVNDGTVFVCNAEGQLVVIDRLGRGSEIESLVLASNR